MDQPITNNQKTEEVKSVLKGVLNEQANTWNAKAREKLTFRKLLELEWLHDGTFVKSDKKFIDNLKSLYFSYQQTSFTTSSMVEDYYVVHEIFGPKQSPDYMFITPKGFFGIEDKSGKNGNIEWNTGSPGENKIITFFHKKEKTVHLISSYEYNWTIERQIKYKELKKDVIDYGYRKWAEMYPNSNEKVLQKMIYYARPMLRDANKVVDLYDPEEKGVNKILNQFFDENTPIDPIDPMIGGQLSLF